MTSSRAPLVYWISTGIIVFIMTFSIINFVFNDHFPFPNGKESAFRPGQRSSVRHSRRRRKPR